MPYGKLTKSQYRAILRPYRRRRKKTVKQEVQQIIHNRGEYKYYDRGFFYNPVSTGATVTHLTYVAAGSTVSNREGNRVEMQSIQLRGSIVTAATEPNDTVLRFVLFVIKDTHQEDIETNASATMAKVFTADSLITLRNPVYMSDYRIIFDKTIIIPATNPSATGLASTRIFKYYKRFKKPIEVRYISNATTYEYLSNNHMYLACITNQPADHEPLVTMNSRFGFKDI